MTTTTASSRRRRRKQAGFTLVEMLISVAIASMALAATLSSLLFISRSSIAATDYAGMDREARVGLEVFAREVRMAQSVDDFSSFHVDLTVPTSSGSYSVEYRYVPNLKSFYRNYGLSDEQMLIKGIDRFALTRYTLQQDPASNNLETKQLQLELHAERTGPARAFASNNVISARYILRNKIVSD